MCCKVIVVFPESVLQSDRGWCCKVIVDKSAYPKALCTVPRLLLPGRGQRLLPSDRGLGGGFWGEYD
jgi:hypothetical protein